MTPSGVIEQAISHYRVLKKLGAGGMGEVYLAEDTTLDRRVALKLLPPEHTQDQERVRRFRQEAKAASALNHPNILTIHEVGEAEGRHFIATEFIDGETLREALRRTGRMEAGEALNVAAQVASALAVAHEAGIVHRDIKPENIMLRSDGYVKVLDFGVAKLTETIGPQSDETSTRTIPFAANTEAGVVLGTAQYMSPEQATGRTVDARADIFSFGAVLYEMVTGQRAFQGASLMETMAAILNQEPKPLPAKVSPDLARLILRCLRKDPARRYQTMADLKVALEDLREETRSGQRVAVSLRRHWTWTIGAALLLVALLFGLSVWQPWRARQNAEPLRAVALTTLPGVEQSPSLSPDGKYVVFAWTGPRQDNQDVYVQMIGSGSPLALTTNPLNDYGPVWSPDGRWIAFFRSEPTAPTGPRSRELRVIPPLGGPERKVADIRSHDFFPVGRYLAWSPDSSALVVTDSPGEGQPEALFVVSLETGEKRRLTDPRSPVLADTSPAVSPDGRSLVFLRKTTWAAGELHLLPLGEGLTAAGEPRRLTSVDQRADYPAWMPDSAEIVFSARHSLWKLAVAGAGPPSRIPYVGEDGLTPTISRGAPGEPARLVYVRSSSDTNFWRIETSAPGVPSSAPPVLAISSTRWEYHAAFSPDGRRVAFTSLRSGDAEIWVANPDGSDAVKLTSTGALDTNCPYWSPDGQLIAFSSNGEGEFDVYVVPAAGGKPRRLTSHPAIDLCPTFSRDGNWIYFSSMRSGDYRTWKMPAAGGDAVQVTSNQAGRTFEAPDGSSLYYLAISVVSPLWRLPTSGGEPAKVADGVVWFNFWVLEKGAYYIDRLGGEARLQYLDFATRTKTTIARHLGDVSAGLTASPDGKTILFARRDSSADDLMLVENFR
jgi:Tol biopolymer transport system component/predicted Ser/Thr protein kinase